MSFDAMQVLNKMQRVLNTLIFEIYCKYEFRYS